MADNSLILPEDAAATSEPQTFPPFPGLYTPGVPVALETIGLEAKEAKEQIEALNLPLELTSKKAPDPEPLPVPGSKDADLAPGDAVPFLPPGGPIHSSPEGAVLAEGVTEAVPGDDTVIIEPDEEEEA